MKHNDIDPLWLMVLMGPLGSLAGCAALLRSGQKLTRRAFWTAILNSGMLAIAIFAGMYWWKGVEVTPLSVALGILAGLGGNTAIDFCLALLQEVVKGKVGKNDK